jgi:fibronectin type 3 domain-containing protein/type II secretory pathway pseudopilin PulG
MSLNRLLRRPPSDDDSGDRGDTLVEVLVAVVIIGMAVAALLGTLLTTTSASVAHRSTTSFDTYVASFAETARNQIELQAYNGSSSGPTFTACTTASPVSYDLVGAPIPHTVPANSSVAVLGSGFMPTGAKIGSTTVPVSTTTTSSAHGFIAQFNVPKTELAGTYSIALLDSSNVSHLAASSLIVTQPPAPFTTATFSNYDTFSVAIGYWNSGWTTNQASCTGSTYNPNIQQLKIGLNHAQPNNGADSVQTIVVSNLSPQGLSAPPAVLAAATPAGSPRALQLSWYSPTYQGVAAVTSFNIYRSLTAGSAGPVVKSVAPCSPSPCQNVYTDTGGLADGTVYYYEVTAVSSVGESDPSTQATATTLPGAPTGLTATRGNAQVALTWSAPSPNGDAPITAYNVYRNTTATQPAAPLTSVSPGSCAPNCNYTDAGLTNGTTYYYWVTTVNGGGEGAASSASATPATTPSAPQSFKVAPTNTAGQLQLSWAVPSSNGGLAISSYNVYRNTTNSQPAAPLTSVSPSSCTPGCSYLDAGLTNGTQYFYWVTAVNGVGEGPVAGPASWEAGAPGAPTALTASAQAKKPFSVTLNWTAPSTNGGSSITTYNIYRSTTTPTAFTLIGSVTGSTLTYQDTAVSNGTTYFYEVTAVNGANLEGGPSNQISATPGNQPKIQRPPIAAPSWCWRWYSFLP